MIRSLETLAQLERETGFRAGMLEKVLRLGAIAREISAHPVPACRAVSARSSRS